MILLPGYAVTGLLYESRQSRVMRARRLADNLPVIFKVPNEDIPSPERRARFQREYDLMRKLHSNAIPDALGMESCQGLQVMILEDFGGTSLNNLGLEATLPMKDWLELAARIAACLTQLHRQHVMHKEINPANIVWNRQTGQVKLIDFGIATELTREVPEVRSPDRLEGTLAYMSPEQTGRMNRAMDYRTDFYSLGVTFYELLCGVLPFASGDALEMVHAHLAHQPVPLAQIRPGTPAMVSAIIDKLMAKTAEERYQSAGGLEHDLQTCLETLDADGQIAPFPLGRKDFSGRLQVSQKLYGRDAQLATLMDVFDRASRGPAELLLVAGYSGVGKSALVHEIQKPITQRRGIFIEGKFDQFKRDIPYASLSQAFRELVQQVLTEGDAVVATWKDRLLYALGDNAQVIISVIPTLVLILGPQPPVPELPAEQAQNRFHNEFRKFVATFATADHPLVIFLDDLQWADLPSLQLMSLLLRAPATPHLLLIGAYRDNEITAAHALRLTFDELEKNGAAVHTMTLPPLNLDEVNALLCDTLLASTVQVGELAQLCLAKTEGNPFFLSQFLAALVDQMIVCPDPAEGGWLWDIDNVRKAGITDNIVELMVAKLHKLPAPTQYVLQGAACLGNTFELSMLAAVCGLAEAETARRLWDALQQEVIVALDDNYRYAEQPATAGESSLLPSYRFLHDRVHQAANLLSSDAEKAAMHLAIGRLWLMTYSPEEQQALLFDLANHLNLGRGLMTDYGERSHLARLNLTAARRAKASVAYKPALMYLQTALELLDESDWQSQYDLMFALHLEAAEAAHLSAEPIQMDRYIETALRRAKDLLDQAKAHEIRIQAYITQDKYIEVVDSGLTVLRLLGIHFPKKPNKLHVVFSLIQTKLALAGKQIEDLTRLPDATDPRILAACKILSKIVSAAYYVLPTHLPLFPLKGIRLLLKYGHTAPTSACDLAAYGMLLGGVLGEIKQGARFGDLALRVQERPEMAPVKSHTHCLVYGAIRPWSMSLHDTIAPLERTYLSGVELGDIEFASIAAVIGCYHRFFCGNELTKLERDTGSYLKVSDLSWPTARHSCEVLHAALLTLIDQDPDLPMLQGRTRNTQSGQQDEPTMIEEPVVIASIANMFQALSTRMMLTYLFHDYRRALAYANRAEIYCDTAIGYVGVAIFHFYSALVRLAQLDTASATERMIALHKIRKSQKKLAHWAKYAPDNFLHKWHLVEAELARKTDRILDANHAYEKAMRMARESNFPHEEALAKELAGEHYLEQGIESIALAHLRDAQHGYRRWGALAKVRDMTARYPQWLGEQAPTSQDFFARATETVSMTSTSDMLDFATVMKASQALSQEIVLERLLKRLMHVVVESAGAQRSVLLLKKGEEWFVEAEKSDGQADATVLQSVALASSEQDAPLLPLSLVHYIARTKESIVIHEALKEKLVASDPYVQRHRPRSLLILPILHQGELTGMLYLENN
ncbi:MAG: putative ATPase, partial [Candidatus Paceibacteria bacterium]